jgi:hypothetical protein
MYTYIHTYMHTCNRSGANRNRSARARYCTQTHTYIHTYIHAYTQTDRGQVAPPRGIALLEHATRRSTSMAPIIVLIITAATHSAGVTTTHSRSHPPRICVQDLSLRRFGARFTRNSPAIVHCLCQCACARAQGRGLGLGVHAFCTR